MRAKPLILTAVLPLLALPLDASSEVQVVKMRDFHTSSGMPVAGHGPWITSTLRNEQIWPASPGGVVPTYEDWKNNNVYEVYTVKEVIDLLGEKERKIEDANQKIAESNKTIAQLRTELADLAKQYGTLVKRIEAVEDR